MPPDRNAPSGTSAIRRRRVAARMASRIGSCSSRGSLTVELALSSPGASSGSSVTAPVLEHQRVGRRQLAHAR